MKKPQPSMTEQEIRERLFDKIVMFIDNALIRFEEDGTVDIAELDPSIRTLLHQRQDETKDQYVTRIKAHIDDIPTT